MRGRASDYGDVNWGRIWDTFTPIEETLRALDDQVRAGKGLYIGISDAPAWVVSRANAVAEGRGWTRFAMIVLLLPMAERWQWELR